MAHTSEAIAALLSGQEGGESERVAQLQQVLESIRGQGEAGLDDFAVIVEKLADAARDSSWRNPLGESGFLEYVLSTVSVRKPQHPLNKQALRLIGNACADCDENRARVVASGALRSFIKAILEDTAEDAALPFAIAAALNACVDYKPAQEQASEAGLSRVLVDIVSGERLSSCQSFLGHIMTILELLCNQDAEPKVANPNTPALLLSLATSERYDADLDSFLEICTPALAYLTFQDIQPHLLQNNGIELLLQAFHQLYTRFDVAGLDPDTAKQLKQVGDAFLSVLADISALPNFATVCPLDGGHVQTLVGWLGLPLTFSHLQTAACLSLGNLSRSDESSTALLGRVQEPLLAILSHAIPSTFTQSSTARTPTPSLQLTHAALSFLKNLAIAQPNKPLLGAALLDTSQPLLPLLWTSTRTQPQLQFTAVSLTRLLLANCPSNVRCICTPLPDDGDHQHPSNLALLASTAAAADEDPIKIEAARAASLVCRALHSHPVDSVLDPSWTWTFTSSSTTSDAKLLTHTQNQTITHPSNEEHKSEEEEEEILSKFYTTHKPLITTSLHNLLTQTRFPTLRSETIFVLALMSRSPSAAGARAALDVLQPPSTTSTSTNTTSTAGTTGTTSQDISHPGNTAAAWKVLASVITGSDSGDEIDELIAAACPTSSPSATARRVEEIHDDGQVTTGERETEKKEEKEEESVTVEKLSLEPQQLEPLAQKEQPARAAKMDRENAMVLVAELLRRFPQELSSLRRPLEAVLNKGGGMVVLDREGRS